MNLPRRRRRAPLFGRPWIGALLAGVLVVAGLVILLGPRPAPSAPPCPASPALSVMPEDLDR